MSLFRHSLLASVCLLVSAWTSFAQTQLFLLPNTSSQAGTVTAFRLDPFTTISSFTAQTGAAFFFVNSEGTKYYSVARSGSDTLMVLEAANPANVLKRQNLSQAEAATLTPDGRRLLIVANGLHIFDTTTDNLLNTVTSVGNQPIDVAVLPDATRAFVLSAVSNSLTAVDLNTNAAVGAPLTIGGALTGVSVGYNGLVYVTTSNRLYEIDGRSMTIRTEIPLNARPGKIVFTPDGQYGLMVNQTPVTGSSVILVDLRSRTVAGTIPNFGPILDSLTVASNNRVYAISNQTQALFEISLSPLNINPPQFANIGTPNNVTALVGTNETPNPRFLFAVTPGSVIRLDNTSVPPAGIGAASIPANPGALVFAARALVGATPTQILGYNSIQSTAVGTAYQPLITRVLNSTGTPIKGVSVTFASDNSAAQIQGGTVVTNDQGYAVTNVIAPPTAGTFTVTATAGTGGASAPTFQFTLTTGSTTGGGTPTGLLKIVRGQGQLVQEQFQITEPMTVEMLDTQGRPAVNQTITFSLQTGSGSFNTSTSDGTVLPGATCSGNVCTVQTDANGRAGIGFIATSVNPGQSYAQQTITATNGTNTVNFILTSILGQLLGGGSASPPIVERIKPVERDIVGQAGTTVNEAIQVRVIVVSGPQSGQVIPNVSLRASTGNTPGAGPTGNCVGEGDVALTDSNGVATCNLAVGGRLGIAPLQVVVGGTINLGGASLNLDVRPGPPSTIRLVQGNNQSGAPGERLRLAFVAEVSDAFSNVLPNVAGQWEVAVPNSITLANVVSTSDSTGRVSALGTLGTVPGSNLVRYRVGNATGSFTFNVNIAITGLAAVAGSGQTTITGQPFPQPLIVQVTDDRGAPTAGQPVVFSVVGGSATLSAATVNSGADGRASVNVTAGPVAGTITIRASLGNLSQTFTLTSRLPGPVFSVNNIVNTASNQPGLVPCGIGTLFGTGIAPTLNGVLPANLLGFGGLPLILNGVEINFDGQAAPILAIANQNRQESIIFQTPCNLVPGNRVTATVRVSGGSTSASGIQVLRTQPGIFETDPGNGVRRYAAVQRPDGSWVTLQNPARRGEVLKMLVTGLGSVTPATDTNRAGIAGQLVQAPLIVGLNDAGIRLVSAEYAVGMMGIYVVAFEVPLDAAPGQYRSLAIAAEGLNGELVFGNSSAVAAIQ